MQPKTPTPLLFSLLLMVCSCASAPDTTPPSAAPPEKEASVAKKHALDVPLEQLSTETHEVKQYQLDACREARIPQACHDLAQELEDNHRYTVIDAFKQASAIACDGLITEACEEISRPAPPEKAPVCSHKENTTTDEPVQSDEERSVLVKQYKAENKKRLDALYPAFGYCADRSARTQPFEGGFNVRFHVNGEGRARVARITPEIKNLPFRACIVSVFERATFTPHTPLVCAYYNFPMSFSLLTQ